MAQQTVDGILEAADKETGALGGMGFGGIHPEDGGGMQLRMQEACWVCRQRTQ